MTDTLCAVCLKRPTPDGWACGHCADRAAGHLAAIVELAPDARLVAAGLVRRGRGGSGGKPASRPPLNDGATDALDEIDTRLARLALDIARTRGVKLTMSCIPTCRRPSPTQAHCSACHDADRGIWRWDSTGDGPSARRLIATADETGPGVPRDTPNDFEPAETPSCA